MKVPISWLKNYININESNLDDLLHRLTLAGTEVESMEVQGNWEGVIVGQVLEISKHPNADRLNLVKVNPGDNIPIAVVCGANNLYVNQKIAFAPVGSKLFSPKSNKMETLKKSKIRGEISNGMICSSLELGLGEATGVGAADSSSGAPLGTQRLTSTHLPLRKTISQRP